MIIILYSITFVVNVNFEIYIFFSFLFNELMHFYGRFFCGVFFCKETLDYGGCFWEISFPTAELHGSTACYRSEARLPLCSGKTGRKCHTNTGPPNCPRLTRGEREILLCFCAVLNKTHTSALDIPNSSFEQLAGDLSPLCHQRFFWLLSPACSTARGKGESLDWWSPAMGRSLLVQASAWFVVPINRLLLQLDVQKRMSKVNSILIIWIIVFGGAILLFWVPTVKCYRKAPCTKVGQGSGHLGEAEGLGKGRLKGPVKHWA